MNGPERTYDRLQDVAEKIREVEHEESAENTVIGGEEFSNLEWLVAERRALINEKRRMEETVTINGEFAGLKRSDV